MQQIQLADVMAAVLSALGPKPFTERSAVRITRRTFSTVVSTYTMPGADRPVATSPHTVRRLWELLARSDVCALDLDITARVPDTIVLASVPLAHMCMRSESDEVRASADRILDAHTATARPAPIGEYIIKEDE